MKRSALRAIPWFFLARVAWLSGAAFILVVDLSELVRLLPQLGQVCTGAPCPAFALTSVEAGLLATISISPGLFAALELAANVLQTLIWVAVSWIIFWRRPGDWVALVGSFALLTFGSAILNPLFFNASPPAPFLLWIKRLFWAVAEFSFAFFLVFPDGRWVPRWTRWAVLAWAAVWLPVVFFPGYDPYQTVLRWPGLVAPILVVLLAQVYRFRVVSGPVQRQQTKWVLYGLGVMTGFYALGETLFALFPALNNTAAQLTLDLLLPFVGSLLPLAFGVSMLRYRLWDIDFIIRRTLLYAALTALLALLYGGSVILLQAFFRRLTGQASPAAIVISTLAIAALFNPLRLRLQRFIDRRFHRGKYDSEQTLERFSAAVREEVDLDRLTARLVYAVDETLQPETVSFWLRE